MSHSLLVTLRKVNRRLWNSKKILIRFYEPKNSISWWTSSGYDPKRYFEINKHKNLSRFKKKLAFEKVKAN